MDSAFLTSNDITALRPCTNFERVPSSRVGQPKTHADAEMVGMTSGATANFVDPSPLVQCVIRRKAQSLSRKA